MTTARSIYKIHIPQTNQKIFDMGNSNIIILSVGSFNSIFNVFLCIDDIVGENDFSKNIHKTDDEVNVLWGECMLPQWTNQFLISFKATDYRIKVGIKLIVSNNTVINGSNKK